MPYVNKPRPYKKEYQQQVSRGEHADRMERQRARRAVDKRGKDADHDGTADRREGKDIAHRRALSKGGTNADGLTARFFEGKCVAVLLSTEKGKKFEKGKQQTLWESEFGTEKIETIKPQEGFYQGERGWSDGSSSYRC